MPNCGLNERTEAERQRGFLRVVQETVKANEQRTFASWYSRSGTLSDARTFGEIWDEAGKIAYYIRCKWNVKKGQRVVLCYDFGLHFFEAFFGCLRAGVTAVLVYPPGPPLKKSLTKLAKVVIDCKPALILTDTRVNRLRLLDKSNPLSKTSKMWPDQVEFKPTDKLSSKSRMPRDEEVDGSDLAFLQYTSGSTGEPKGVMVTFNALDSNIELILSFMYDGYRRDGGGGIPDEVVGFSWLPQYHDLGLIFAVIAPFVGGWRMHMISPISFIQNPLLWLELMSRYRVQWTAAPDFAYQLVVRKFQQSLSSQKGIESPIPGLDLSRMRHMVTAAEPCRPETHAKFSEAFVPYGLKDYWYVSAYGLAENVVGFSYLKGLRLSTPRKEDNSKTYVACCKLTEMHPSIGFKIVDPGTGVEVGDEQTGELWIAGGSVAGGYFGKPELSQQTFKARLPSMPRIEFLRTGDLFFTQSGYLYICGRIKDLIIINGVNYYPQDIEFAVQEASSAVRPGCVAAFSAGEIESESSVDVVFEIRHKYVANAEDVACEVRNTIMSSIGLPVGRIVAIVERTIPKTTSGKIQRRATREALNNEKLQIVHCSFSPSDARAETLHKGGAKTNNPPDETEQGLEPPRKRVARSYRPGTFDKICSQFLGGSFDADLTWEDLGLSSMASIGLRDALSDKLFVTLSPNFVEEYPTPGSLRKFIESQNSRPFPIAIPELQRSSTNQGRLFPWARMALLQGFGLALLFLVIAFSFFPAYHLGKFLASIPRLTVSTSRVEWQWLPFVIPAWMTSFSLLVIASKWLLIGRYTEVEVLVPSLYYLRWWFVDRLVDVWEQWVGRFIRNTPLLWLVYFFLGANIHPSAKLDAFVREFDLVHIGGHSKIEFDVVCRRFSAWETDNEWETDNDLRLRLRRIQIGCHCVIRGLVGPGACIGEGSYVERLSAVPESAQVPMHTVAKGSPAINEGVNSPNKDGSSVPPISRIVLLETMKLVGLAIELYLFFVYLSVGKWTLHDFLPLDFRYTPLLYWVLLLSFSTLLSMVTCVSLKWLLIGKKWPGRAPSGLWTEFTDWFVDYHFNVSITILETFAAHSKVFNVYLSALGMDIDLASHVWAANFPPSKLDLVTIKGSFLSITTLDVNPKGTEYQRIEVYHSTLGSSVALEGGTVIQSSHVLPFSIVKESVPDQTSSGGKFSSNEYHWTEFWCCLVVVFIVAGAIPAYELFCWEAGDPLGIGFSVAKVALVLFVQMATWSFLFSIFNWFLFTQSPQGEWNHCNRGLYEVYMAVSCCLMWRSSLLNLTWGTPFINSYLRCLGANVEGHLLYFAASSYDFPLLTFRHRTVVDRAVVFGHIFDQNGLWFGPSTAAGVLHRGSLLMANGDLTGRKEIGPMVSLFGSSQNEDLSLCGACSQLSPEELTV